MTRPAYVQMAVRVPRELKAQMELLATEQGKHVSELVRELLTEGMKDRGAPIKPPVPLRSGD
jgi:predicted DNA-binding protein